MRQAGSVWRILYYKFSEVLNMKKIVIKSENSSDTPAQIEEILVKAVSSIKEQRDNKPLKDEFLKGQIEIIDKLFDKIMDNLLLDLEEVIK